MMRLFALGAVAMAWAVSASAEESEKIAIPSVTPTSLLQLLQHQSPAATVSGELYIPDGSGPFPAMILKHGSGGLVGPTGANIAAWARTITGWGIAAFVVDSFGPRGLTTTAKDQSLLSPWADLADAFAALKVLAADSRIERSRIGIIGWSRGGTIAANTTLETVRKAIITDDLKFAAHVVFYGSETTQYRDAATDKSPVIFFHGEADNYVPMAPTKEFAGWLQSMGNPVTFVSYPATYHDFDVAGGYSGFAKSVQVGANCDVVIDMNGVRVVRMGHKDAADVTPDALGSYYKSCAAHGANLAFNASARANAVEKTHTFLRSTFGLQ